MTPSRLEPAVVPCEVVCTRSGVRAMLDRSSGEVMHPIGGPLEEARRLALRNMRAFERSGAERIVVNAAGCGALMKEYGELFEHTERWFAIAHPYEKLDHIAIPLTVGFAMENAGLVM